MTLSVSRRALMKGAGAGFAAALFQPAVRAAASQESQTDWSGWTICDSCNHMPMCGIHFKARGNTIRCHTNFRHPFNLSWSGKTCDIRRSSKTTS